MMMKSKFQIPKSKPIIKSQIKRILVLLFVIGILDFICHLNFGICHSYAEESKVKTTEELAKCICEEKSTESACLVELKEMYFKDNKYTDFVELLKGLCPDNRTIQPAINYYIALSRYSQLKYLEESKGWDEYFAKGNDYRDDIVNSTQKAITATSAKDAVNIHSRLLSYQFHKDQQDTSSDAALTGLMSSISEYAKGDGDIKVIKEAADKLLAYGENGKSKELYKIYAEKLSGPQVKDAELKDIAANFYKDGNVELAGNIYDIYIQRISGALAEEELIKELTGIARNFVYKDNAPCDTDYAEKIFKKIEEIGGAKAFNEGLLYLRGFNLEKAKSYTQAKDIYVGLITRFPRSEYKSKLVYKIGIIYTYVLRDLKTGRNYFEQLSRETSSLPYALAGLYQLGLLKQWEGSLSEAKGYYDKLLQKIGDTDLERLALAQERLAEITQNKPLEYNIKTGLDTALKEEYVNLDMSKINLKSSSYLPEKGKEVDISCATSLGPSGCLQIELQYLWSGDLGGVKPGIAQPEFKTSYKSPGTKLIVMVLVTPEGMTERGIDLIDVK